MRIIFFRRKLSTAVFALAIALCLPANAQNYGMESAEPIGGFLDGVLPESTPGPNDGDKEDLALMGLKVIAADGRRDFAEMEQFNRAMTAIGIAPEIVHRAFDRYFAETMPGE